MLKYLHNKMFIIKIYINNFTIFLLNYFHNMNIHNYFHFFLILKLTIYIDN